MEEKIFGKIESISMQGLTKSYGSTLALKDFNLEVEGGELIILIGPSGSGKTTALKTINRLIEPDQGSVIINGHNILSYNPVELRRNIGYVIQQIGLFPHLNIKDNIGLIPKIESGINQKLTPG
ncbi:MAG: ATP-binding cassette domain-containing protein [Actinomycetota bacterium]|nr:ATP-binding cassette domain-containing protein [Actinomycetota bacterium]